MKILFKRVFDISFSLIGLIFLSPVFLAVAIMIKLDSPGPVFFRQIRVGKDGKDFYICKFRKMHIKGSDGGPNVTADNDARLTDIGRILMKYKLDELPQIWNVLKGDMSFVGPRPELPCFVRLYDDQQRQILKVKPGITDYAAIEFIDEGELLGQAEDPEKFYVEKLMNRKLAQNFKYVSEMSVQTDLKIILKTIYRIIRKMGGRNHEGSHSSRGQRDKAEALYHHASKTAGADRGASNTGTDPGEPQSSGNN